MPTLPRRAAPAVLFLAACTAAAGGADAVIFPDGFTFQGRYFKEQQVIPGEGGAPLRVARGDGFDVVEDGPKFVIFSSHTQKGGKIEQNLPGRELVAYKKAVQPASKALPSAVRIELTPWGDDWRRVAKLYAAGYPNNPNTVPQTITHLDANTIGIQSDRYAMRLMYHTKEWDPKEVRRLLMAHPDLKEPPDKPDANKRMSVAELLNDVGWFLDARKDLVRLKQDVPGPWDKPTTQRYDALLREVDRAETRFVIDQLELAAASGRYESAREVLKQFVPKEIEAKDNNRIAGIRAQVETVQPKYELTVRLLRSLTERESGLSAYAAHAAAAGTAAGLYYPRPRLGPDATALTEAASAILDELHPDSADRIDLFRSQAEQAEKAAAAGRKTTDSPAELLALAVSGWVLGKNSAGKNVDGAVRAWAARKMVLDYLREPIGNKRAEILDAYRKTPQPFDHFGLSQIITLLPPIAAEDLAKPAGKPVKPADVLDVAGITKETTRPVGGGTGFEYVLKLPPEYHHGRAYPVILALTTPQLPAEKMVAALSDFAGRHGYIVAAPNWCPQFGGTQQYDFTGKEHPHAIAVLRDVARRFQIDPDKVYPFGAVEGANFAFGLGMAHPDLFAGVVLMGGNVPQEVGVTYWRNAQKLPIYVVCGEVSGSFGNFRRLFEKWMPNGFPSIMTVYKGRGAEWYTAELPRIFDWMGRKKRVRGAAGLRLNNFAVEPWQVARQADDRYYWVGVADGGLTFGDWVPGKGMPASFRADIRNGAVVIEGAIGVKKFNVWLDRDLINWDNPLVISLNGSKPVGYTPKKMVPDVHLMLEELYRTGDRKLLFLGKVEINGQG